MIRFPVSSDIFIVPRHVPPSAWIGHIPFASWLMSVLRPAIVVELGTHHGTSFLAFCQIVEQKAIPAKVFAVDTWEGDHQAGAYGNEVYMALRDYQQRNYAGQSEMLRMTFDDALAYFDDGSVDLLHIDGLHTYEAVRHDFETWLPKVSSRGVVIFHDTCVRGGDFGVWKFWAEIRGQYPSFEFTHTHGLGVLMVGPDQADELKELAATTGEDSQALINQLFDSLGRNLKNITEIERVNSALTGCHAEIARLNAALEARDGDFQHLVAREGESVQLTRDAASQLHTLQRQTGERLEVLQDALTAKVASVQEAVNVSIELATRQSGERFEDVMHRLDSATEQLGHVRNTVETGFWDRLLKKFRFGR